MERKALEGMINNFGQTPCQLLKVSFVFLSFSVEYVFQSSRTGYSIRFHSRN